MRRRASAMAGWLVVAACGLDPVIEVIDPSVMGATLASAVCRARYDCPCFAPPWPDRDTCVEQVRQQYDDAEAIAIETGLAYDPQCAAAVIDAYRDAACDPDPMVEACGAACRIFVGAGGLGEPCERLGLTVDLDTCGADLRCEDARCVPRCAPPAPLQAGDRCRAGIAELGTCATGLLCPADGETCVEAPGPGEPCVADACGPTSWCDRAQPDPVCEARGEPGESCGFGFQCTSDHCVGGACEPVDSAACAWPTPFELPPQ